MLLHDHIFRSSSAALLAISGAVMAQEASFQGLGDLPGGPFLSRAYGISENGVYIVGMGTPEDYFLSEGFIWSEATGMIALPDLPGGHSNALARDCTDDGQFVAGQGKSGEGQNQPVRWVGQTPQGLGWLPGGDNGFSHDLSADGSVLVGYSRFDDDGTSRDAPFRWSNGNYENLGSIRQDGIVDGEAWAVSADGSIVVGEAKGDNNFDQPFRWESGIIMPLDMPANMIAGSARDVSADGRIIMGVVADGTEARLARWIDGVYEDLGVLDGWTPYAMSDDGTEIVGSLGMIWDETNGARPLKDVLENEYGLDLTGWDLMRIYDVSADGRVLAGWGVNPNGDKEAFRAVLPSPDTDGDGLSDSWETDGIDINNDGIIDLDLPALGADPMRKDLFVEVDIMEQAPFTPAAIQAVIDAFANAPLENPDGSTGITLHVDWENHDLIEFAEFWDQYFVAFDIAKDQFFGTSSQRDDSNWEHIEAAKKRAYRYCIFAHRLLDSQTGFHPSGRAELPGNDFMVALGGTQTVDPDRLIAIVFMHELGHTLGLGHGGNDNVHYKPNYVSVMNYHFMDLFTATYDLPPLDYSREDLADLDESSIDENAGIASVHSGNVWMRYFYRETFDGPIHTSHILLDGAQHDWNHDGMLETSVEIDVNNGGFNSEPSPGETLEGYNDWHLIQLPIGTDGDFADYVHETVDYPEIDEETIEWIQSLPPPPINVATLHDLTVIFGELLAGDVNDLVASDQERITVRSERGFSVIEPDIMRLVVGATTDVDSAAALNLIFEGRINHPNGTGRLLLKDWMSEDFVQQNEFTLDFTEEQKFIKDIPAANYVRASDGRIEVAVHQYVAAVFSALGFDSHIDRIEISVRPE